jgi:hypothetical protein
MSKTYRPNKDQHSGNWKQKKKESKARTRSVDKEYSTPDFYEEPSYEMEDSYEEDAELTPKKKKNG